MSQNGLNLLWQYFKNLLMEPLLSVTLKTTKRKSWTFHVERSWEMNFHAMYLGPKTGGQSKWSHPSPPSQLSQGSKCYQVLPSMIRKIKGHIFDSDMQDDEKHHLHFFSSRLDSFDSQFCFHETQGRSDNPTGKKTRNKTKKLHPSFHSENSQMKRTFLKTKQVGFSALYSQVKQTCTLYFLWT